MRFDDRLATVLAQPAENAHDRAVRWRQLLDLLSRSGAASDHPLVKEAVEAVRGDWREIPEHLRAAAARAVAGRQLSADVVALFAADSLNVSAPVLAAARLPREEWHQLLAESDDQTRKFVQSTHPDLREEAAGEVEQPEARPADAPRREEVVPSISDVLARIERLREVRERAGGSLDRRAPASEAAAPSGIFRWECDSSGEIAWVDGAPRGLLVGRSLVRPEDGADRQIERAFAIRAPFRDARLVLPAGGPAGGDWKISGVPAFEPASGRFAGYRGLASKDLPMTQAASGSATVPADPDSLRELVHEIRTPLNAIIGFAEIIDGQLLGPADSRYRGRAAEIVGQARLLLTALEDLDLSARLRSSPAAEAEGVDLVALLQEMKPELAAAAFARDAEIDFATSTAPVRCAIDRALAERLARRFFGTILASAASGERVRAGTGREAGLGQLWIQLPVALRGLSETDLADIETDAIAADTRFALRLIRGLAGLAGGELVLLPESIALSLPLA